MKKITKFSEIVKEQRLESDDMKVVGHYKKTTPVVIHLWCCLYCGLVKWSKENEGLGLQREVGTSIEEVFPGQSKLSRINHSNITQLYCYLSKASNMINKLILSLSSQSYFNENKDESSMLNAIRLLHEWLQYIFNDALRKLWEPNNT